MQQKDKADSLLIICKVVIVFKDLQKLVSHSPQENTRKELFQRLQGKPFWIWDNSSTIIAINDHKYTHSYIYQRSSAIEKDNHSSEHFIRMKKWKQLTTQFHYTNNK